MNKIYYTSFFFIVAIFTCCTSKHERVNCDLIFQIEKAVPFEESDIFKKKAITHLEISEESLIAGDPSLGLDKEYFIYSRDLGGQVLRFSKDGGFINKIGSTGIGPDEYLELTDINIDSKNRTVEILGANSICKYTYDGDFIKKTSCEFPAFSFNKDLNNNLWLYIGTNKNYSNYRIIKVDGEMNKLKEYLSLDFESLPLMENNFHKCGEITTFHEGLNHKLYIINNDIVESHNISFQKLSLDYSKFPSDPMELLSYLKQVDYALVKSYLENSNYIYIQVLVHNSQIKENCFYNWIINKNNRKELIIKLPDDISSDSYLCSPQILTDDNLLYFIGYPLESVNDSADSSMNPSVISIDISDITDLN